jgi:polysaccharide deacetylase 2 family uncharacterized protein YibQ
LYAAAIITFIVSLSVLAALMNKKHAAAEKTLSMEKPVPVSLAKNFLKNTTVPSRAPIESALYKKFCDMEVRPVDISTHISQPDCAISMQAAIPKGKPPEWVIRQISSAAEGTDYRVFDCVFEEKKQSYTMLFVSQVKKDPPLTLVITDSDKYNSGTAKMAIIVESLEDADYRIAVALLSFPEPFSVSITPLGKKAALIAQLAEQHKKETIIRLPLEPTGKVPKEFETTTIMIHYPREKIHAIISGSVKYIPDSRGFSNLWGSRGLEDSRLMGIVLEEIKKQRGFFLEAPSAKNSVAASLARSIDVPYGEISARLEKTSTTDLCAEIKRYAAAAQLKGSIIVRCAAGTQLIDALESTQPFLKRNGIKLVFASELVKQSK